MAFSVCIPRVFPNITEQFIRHTFESYKLGIVSHVDIVKKVNRYNDNYNMVFVHFKVWYANVSATNLREKIENPNVVAKLVYDDPWYWIIIPNTSYKRENTFYNKLNDITKHTTRQVLEYCVNILERLDKKIERQTNNKNSYDIEKGKCNFSDHVILVDQPQPKPVTERQHYSNILCDN
jgi:hypothetical protein